MRSRVLVAGIGNIFLGDDAFGVEVVRQLSGEPIPSNVQVTDFGVCGRELAFALLEPWRTVVFVDAVARGGRPGTLYLLSPTLSEGSAAEGDPLLFDRLTVDPYKVLELARALGAPQHAIRLVGCEPACLREESSGKALCSLQCQLSEPVRRAVPEAVARVKALVKDFAWAPEFA